MHSDYNQLYIKIDAVIASTSKNENTMITNAWRTFLTTVGTKQFVTVYSKWVPWLSMLACVLLLIGTVWGLAFAPMDHVQGNSFRIIFIHVPSASFAMSIYLMMAILSVIYLVWNIKTSAMVAEAIAPIGFVLCVLTLITGSIWGKPTWGTYWAWDARLTSVLILAFMYIGIIGLYRGFAHQPQAGKPAAILSIAGVVMLPIIKYSVSIWNTLHQPNTFSLTSAPKMPASMYTPLLIMMLGMLLLVMALAIYGSCTLMMKREQHKPWVYQHLFKDS